MSVIDVRQQGTWSHGSGLLSRSSMIKNDILFRRLSQRYLKDNSVETLKARMTATSEKLGAGQFDIDLESESGQSDRIPVEHDTYPDTHSDAETIESEDSLHLASEITKDHSDLSQDSIVKVDRKTGKSTNSRRSIFRIRSKVRRAKKHLAAAKDRLADAGQKIIKGHQQIPPAREGIWMVNNPVYECHSELFEYAMGEQAKSKNAWTSLRYNSLN